jgi:transcriptional regulator with PAS, ATPase and Fis domain
MSNQLELTPLLENIMYFVDEGIMVADTLGNVLYYNPAVNSLLGIPESRTIEKLNDIGHFNLQKALLKAAIDAGEVDAAGKPSGNFINFEQQFKHSKGNRLIEVTSGLITSDRSSEKKRLLLFRDITDTRHMQAVLNPSGTEMTTQDPRLLEIIERLQQIAATNAFILLQGESGTGKTQLGRMIHTQSQRANEAFVEVNCAAIPESLIESELFGHVKGAFTGATNDRQGRFQSAHKGTLFLDEIGEIPIHLQAKLLKAIQDQQFEMVGSDKSVNVDVRIIAASNKNLRDMVDDGKFRADLFYRLAVIPITIPALRDRPGDIPLLSKHFCNQLIIRGYPDDIKCSTEALRMMMNYPWPGNVRELENAVEHGIICASNGKIQPGSLPQDIQDYCSTIDDQPASTPIVNSKNLHAKEIEDAINNCKGSKAAAARHLGVNRTTLWRWIHKYGINA